MSKRDELIKMYVSELKEKSGVNADVDLLTKVTELRSKAMDPGLNSDAKVDIDNQITHAMKGIMVAVENYPDLKANQNFLVQ